MFYKQGTEGACVIWCPLYLTVLTNRRRDPPIMFDRWLKNKANTAPGDRKIKEMEWQGVSVSEKIIAEMAGVFN